ncbi:hypothetical protein MAJHIDBO_01722 [Propionibacterium freudenreichii subsp. shermanii]|nr:hypothetical protein MAJHIDBO_01722 [Propionibacterium freudenreichii subsp. shermanii]SPS09511.1 hypothetical protein MAJHIDBO_01722 [Propionibacterium freudenreichii subsp. shermanii]
MDIEDHIGARDIEDLVTAIVSLEIVRPENGGLEHGSHGPVTENHLVAEHFA